MFKHGISDKFVEQLLDMNWWADIANDADLFLGIRGKSVNVYFQGCSLFNITNENGRLNVSTHYKYLLKANLKQPYLRWTDTGQINLEELSGREPFIGRVDMKALKAASKPYAGAEKQGVHLLLKANPDNVVDVEVALTSEADLPDDDPTAPQRRGSIAKRIDFAAFRRTDNGVALTFFEAKRFDNSELRARGEKTPPKVFKQISDYEALIQREKKAIKDSYRTVCGNLAKLLPNRCSQLIKEIGRGKTDFQIDPEVRLIVFGFDADQSKGAVWKTHRDKLEATLDNSTRMTKRLICVGSPNGFSRGIS